MRIANLALLPVLLCLLPACSPRDFLTRRLAADLISTSDAFKTPQTFWLTTGVVSNKDFTTPESMVLQRRGWIIGNEQKCPVGVEPPPCWDVVLSPLGVDTIRPLIASGSSASGSLGSGASGNGASGNGAIAIQAARREVIAITGMSKSGSLADVEFTWRWVSLNKVGAALYDSGVRYRSTVGFRSYDDGWRVVTAPVRSGQTLDEALRNSELTAP